MTEEQPFNAFPAFGYWEIDGKPVSSEEAQSGLHPKAKWIRTPQQGSAVPGSVGGDITGASALKIAGVDTSVCPHCANSWDRRGRLERVCKDLYETLAKCQDACLFAEDDGQIGLTEDAHIPHELFSEICAALKRARGETDG